MVWYDKKGGGPESGFLIYADMVVKPIIKKYSANVRLQYFETEGYDSRLYAFENDLLYSYSIPVFYDKGYRYYFNFNYDVSKKLAIWIKWSQTIYSDKDVIGSGLDEIVGNKRTEAKFQVIYQFWSFFRYLIEFLRGTNLQRYNNPELFVIIFAVK